MVSLLNPYIEIVDRLTYTFLRMNKVLNAKAKKGELESAH